jgi:hypothetical protein
VRYKYNPYCSCSRCRAHGYMGPAVLITLGVLFLFSQATPVYWLEFDHTWPALLIVIGLVLFLQHSASAYGHVPREYAPPVAPGYQPGYQPGPGQPGAGAPPGSVVTPTPIQPGGNLPAAPYNQGGERNDTGVQNG